MVQINFAQKQINAKIVFYGPGMSGKTTNLEVVHQRAPDKNRGELTSISTDGDRTLFFDYMPLDLGTIAGMRTCFQMYTVPGQVYYNSTRKLVLQGVDGVIFVADSSPDAMEANLESLRNLEENLNEYGKSLATLPHVIQFNKRDIDGALAVEQLMAALNLHGVPTFEAIASTGQGVFPTLKGLASLVLKNIQAECASTGGGLGSTGFRSVRSADPAAAAGHAPQSPAPSAQAPVAPAAMPQAPAHQAPAHQAPAHQAPAHQAPAHQAPVHQAPAHQAPAHQAPVHQAPAHQAPVHQAPAHQAPLHPAPQHQVAAQQAPDLVPPAVHRPAEAQPAPPAFAGQPQPVSAPSDLDLVAPPAAASFDPYASAQGQVAPQAPPPQPSFHQPISHDPAAGPAPAWSGQPQQAAPAGGYHPQAAAQPQPSGSQPQAPVYQQPAAVQHAAAAPPQHAAAGELMGRPERPSARASVTPAPPTAKSRRPRTTTPAPRLSSSQSSNLKTFGFVIAAALVGAVAANFVLSLF
jgi:signal recognition particle receptor subunit beta